MTLHLVLGSRYRRPPRAAPAQHRRGEPGPGPSRRAGNEAPGHPARLSPARSGPRRPPPTRRPPSPAVPPEATAPRPPRPPPAGDATARRGARPAAPGERGGDRRALGQPAPARAQAAPSHRYLPPPPQAPRRPALPAPRAGSPPGAGRGKAVRERPRPRAIGRRGCQSGAVAPSALLCHGGARWRRSRPPAKQRPQPARLQNHLYCHLQLYSATVASADLYRAGLSTEGGAGRY